MEVNPNPKKLFFPQTYNLVYDNKQEVFDVGRWGVHADDGLSILRIATDDMAIFPMEMSHTKKQLKDIAKSLKSYSGRPEVVENSDQRNRLAIESALISLVLSSTTENIHNF